MRLVFLKGRKMLKILKKVFQYFNMLIKDHIAVFIFLIISSIISKVLLLIPPYINGKIIDRVIIKDFNTILFLLSISLLIYLANGLISLFETYAMIYISNATVTKFKMKLFQKLLTLKVSEFDKGTSGEYLERLDGDTSSISSFYIDTLPNLLINIITLIGTGIFSFYLSPLLASVGLISFPISFFINVHYGKKMKRVYFDMRKTTDRLTSISQQILNGERTIKALHIEKSIQECYNSKTKDYLKKSIKSGMISAFGGLAQTIISSFFELFIIGLASYLIIINKLSIGSYVAFNVYLSQFLSALRTIATTNLNIQTVLVAVDRINKVVLRKEEELSNDVVLPPIRGNIRIKELRFSYEGEKKIFDSLNIDFAENSVTAIVGSSGCGKTTLLNLILRFYDINSGSISIDNYDISKLSVGTLRNLISYVQQDSFFLSDTIKNNLTFVNPNATYEEICQSCKDAGIYEKIVNLPSGFDTILGENAKVFSGGEKQRLSIARGFLKKSKIFLFDEVTSNLDGESEDLIARSLLQLGKSNTVIVIAHRLTLVEKMPRIIVLDSGQVVGDGCHSDLLKTCEVYRKLYSQ